MRTDLRLRAPALLVALTLLAGCAAGGGGSTEPSPSGSASPSTPTAGDLPTDPDTLLIEIGFEGGFVLPEMLVTRLPTVAIYADGRVIQQGAQIAIYPGPLLPPLLIGTLPTERLVALLGAAATAGLATGTNATYPATSVADAPDTVFVVWGPAGPTRTGFGAFGMEQQGQSAAALEARAKAATFNDAVTAALAEVTGSAPYRPEAARLFVRAYQNPSPDLPQQEVAWPLSTPLAEAGAPISEPALEGMRCVVVEGAELDTLWPLFQGANALTPFVSDGERYGIQVRPLLPDDEAICP